MVRVPTMQIDLFKQFLNNNQGVLNEDNEGSSWGVNDEIAFFYAALNAKPVGIKKHFEVAAILDNYHEVTGKCMSSETIWKFLPTLLNIDLLDEREDVLFSNEKEDFHLPAEYDIKEEPENLDTDSAVEDKPSTKKVVKDYTRNKDSKARGGKKDEPEKNEAKVAAKSDSASESEEEDVPLKPKATPRGKANSAKKNTPVRKETPKRGTRATRDLDKESSPASTSSKNIEEESSAKKSGVGKRSLRSRGDDDNSSSPAPTPPPTKRTRR